MWLGAVSLPIKFKTKISFICLSWPMQNLSGGKDVLSLSKSSICIIVFIMRRKSHNLQKAIQSSCLGPTWLGSPVGQLSLFIILMNTPSLRNISVWMAEYVYPRTPNGKLNTLRDQISSYQDRVLSPYSGQWKDSFAVAGSWSCGSCVFP